MFARMDKIRRQKTSYLVENKIYIENSQSLPPALPTRQETT